MNKLKLYLGPWKGSSDFGELNYVAQILGTNRGYIIRSYLSSNKWTHLNSHLTFLSKEAAMKDVIDKLSTNYDVITLTQEQFDKLAVLI
jgi:hypothetical protein